MHIFVLTLRPNNVALRTSYLQENLNLSHQLILSENPGFVIFWDRGTYIFTKRFTGIIPIPCYRQNWQHWYFKKHRSDMWYVELTTQVMESVFQGRCTNRKEKKQKVSSLLLSISMSSKHINHIERFGQTLISWSRLSFLFCIGAKCVYL